MRVTHLYSSFFFFNDPAPPEIYPLPLHDALPISMQIVDAVDRLIVEAHDEIARLQAGGDGGSAPLHGFHPHGMGILIDRKSTRLNSSHDQISYAVFCLKKKKTE